MRSGSVFAVFLLIALVLQGSSYRRDSPLMLHRGSFARQMTSNEELSLRRYAVNRFAVELTPTKTEIDGKGLSSPISQEWSAMSEGQIFNKSVNYANGPTNLAPSSLLSKRLSGYELYQLNHILFYAVKGSDPLHQLKHFFLTLMSEKENITSSHILQMQQLVSNCLQPERNQKYYFGRFKERQLNNRLNAVAFVWQKTLSVANTQLTIPSHNENQVELQIQKGMPHVVDLYKKQLFEALSSSDWSEATLKRVVEEMQSYSSLQDIMYATIRTILQYEVLLQSSEIQLYYQAANHSQPMVALKRIKLFGKILSLLGTTSTKFTAHPSDILHSIDRFLEAILSQRQQIFTKVDHPFFYDLFYIQNDRFESLSQPLQDLMMKSAPGGEIFEMIYQRKKQQNLHYQHQFHYLIMMYIRLPSLDLRKASIQQIERFVQLFEEEIGNCATIDEEINYFNTLYFIQFYHLSPPSMMMTTTTTKPVSSSPSGARVNSFKDVLKLKEFNNKLIQIFFNRFPFLKSPDDASSSPSARSLSKFEALHFYQFSSLLRVMYYIFDKFHYSERHTRFLYSSGTHQSSKEITTPSVSSSPTGLIKDFEGFEQDAAFEEDRQKIFDEVDKFSDICNDDPPQQEHNRDSIDLVDEVQLKRKKITSSDTLPLKFQRTIFLKQFYDKLDQTVDQMRGMQIFWTLHIFKNLKIRWADLPTSLHRRLTEAIYLSLIPIALENPKFFYQVLYLLKHELQHPDVYCSSLLLSRCLQIIQLLMRSNRLPLLTWKDINSIFYFMFPKLNDGFSFSTDESTRGLRFDERRQQGVFDDLEVLRNTDAAKSYELALFGNDHSIQPFFNGKKGEGPLALPEIQQNIIERLMQPMIEISQRPNPFNKEAESYEATRASIKYYSSQVLSTGRIFTYMASSSFPRLDKNSLPALKRSILALLKTFIDGIKGIMLAYRGLLIENDFQLSVIFPPALYSMFKSVFIVLSKFRIPFQSLPALQQSLLLFLCYYHEDKVILASLIQSFLYCLAISNEEIERQNQKSSYFWQMFQYKRRKNTWNLLPNSIRMNAIQMIEDLLQKKKKNDSYEVAFPPMKDSLFPFALPIVQLLLSLTSLSYSQEGRKGEGSAHVPKLNNGGAINLLHRMIEYVTNAEKEIKRSGKENSQSQYFLKLMAKFHRQQRFQF